jgi:hypothetical protein
MSMMNAPDPAARSNPAPAAAATGPSTSWNGWSTTEDDTDRSVAAVVACARRVTA